MGYEDGATILYKEKTDVEFFEAEKPLEFIYKINKIIVNKGMFINACLNYMYSLYTRYAFFDVTFSDFYKKKTPFL